MHPSQEIAAKIEAYLSRSISLEDLRAWFRGSAGVLFEQQESQILDLAASLQLAFLECDKGEFSERQLRSYLKHAVQEILSSEPASLSQ